MPERLGSLQGIALSEYDMGDSLKQRLQESTRLTQTALRRVEESMSRFDGQLQQVVQAGQIVTQTVASIGGDLTVDGDIFMTDTTATIDASAAALTIASGLTVQNATVLQSTVNVTGAATLQSTLSTGDITITDATPAITSTANAQLTITTGTSAGAGAAVVIANQTGTIASFNNNLTWTNSTGSTAVFNNTSPDFFKINLTQNINWTGAAILPVISDWPTYTWVTVNPTNYAVYINGSGVLTKRDSSGSELSLESQGHTIEDDGTPLTTRSSLDFQNYFVITDNAGADATEVDLDLAMTPTWTGEHIFSAGASFLDNDIATFGTGDDMSLYHDGTTNFIQSDIANANGAKAQRMVWAVGTNRTSLGGTTNTPEGDGKLILEIGHTDGAAAFSRDWGMYPYVLANPNTPAGPALIHFPWDNVNTTWAIGACASDGKFSGMTSQGTAGTNVLSFYANDAQSFATIDRGLVMNSTLGRCELRTASGKNLFITPNNPVGSSTQGWVMVYTQANMTGSGSTERLFNVKHNAVTDKNVFSCWPGVGYGSYMVGVDSDVKLCFDGNDGTRGDTHIEYVSSSGELLFTVDGSECMVMDDSTGARVGFFGAAPVAQQADISALTDNTGGTADNTVAAVDTSGGNLTTNATINDNFADLASQINDIRTVLRNLGLMA